eukprot:m.184754 g.184754  ORF g.184754 m.184754 type:complete len:207 (-) comp14719_c0_seq1:728-1348(-)
MESEGIEPPVLYLGAPLLLDVTGNDLENDSEFSITTRADDLPSAIGGCTPDSIPCTLQWQRWAVTPTKFRALSPPHVQVSQQPAQFLSFDNVPYLAAIDPAMSGKRISVLGGVMQVTPPTTVRTRRGTAVGMASLLLGDHTRQYFRITTWAQKAAEWCEDVKPGDIVGCSVAPQACRAITTSFKPNASKMKSHHIEWRRHAFLVLF